jgi:large subunit ribosomal protein L2
MGKTLIQQARGKGSPTYRVRRRAFRYEIKYPALKEGSGKVIKLIDSPGHTAPLAKILMNNCVFYIPACRGMYEGQEIFIGKDIKDGNIAALQNIPLGVPIYNIEAEPFDGGKFIRTSGNSAVITRKTSDEAAVLFPSKKEKVLHGACRATLGVIAGAGRLEKPFIKAGKKFYSMKTRNKLWPRTSAIKMNAIDHPFGSGRGKNPKSKIAKRNAPAGAKVGHLRPKRTGRRKK